MIKSLEVEFEDDIDISIRLRRAKYLAILHNCKIIFWYKGHKFSIDEKITTDEIEKLIKMFGKKYGRNI
jgi:ferredoxin-fold anticodon binding domain-containing protein